MIWILNTASNCTVSIKAIPVPWVFRKNIYKAFLRIKDGYRFQFNLQHLHHSRRETGDVRLDTWDWIRETLDVRLETWDKRREIGDVRQETWDRRVETGDVIQETWYRRCETGGRMCWKEMEIDMRTGIQNLNAFADIVPTYDQCCGATTFLGGSGYGRLRSRSWLQAK